MQNSKVDNNQSYTDNYAQISNDNIDQGPKDTRNTFMMTNNSLQTKQQIELQKKFLETKTARQEAAAKESSLDSKQGLKVKTQLKPSGSSKKIIHSPVASNADMIEEKLDQHEIYSQKVFNDLMSLY